MKDALIVGALILAAWFALGWSTAPMAVSAAQHRADVAEARVVDLQTQVAYLRPTPRPCALTDYVAAC